MAGFAQHAHAHLPSMLLAGASGRREATESPCRGPLVSRFCDRVYRPRL